MCKPWKANKAKNRETVQAQRDSQANEISEPLRKRRKKADDGYPRTVAIRCMMCGITMAKATYESRNHYLEEWRKRLVKCDRCDKKRVRRPYVQT